MAIEGHGFERGRAGGSRRQENKHPQNITIFIIETFNFLYPPPPPFPYPQSKKTLDPPLLI